MSRCFFITVPLSQIKNSIQNTKCRKNNTQSQKVGTWRRTEIVTEYGQTGGYADGDNVIGVVWGGDGVGENGVKKGLEYFAV